MVDEAVDGYLRYLLTTPAQAADPQQQEARAFIQDQKRITAATLDRLL